MLGLAEVASSSGQPEQATRLLGAAETARRRVGLVTYGRTAERQPVRVAALRKALGETAFAAAWEAGASLPLEDAVAEALAVRART